MVLHLGHGGEPCPTGGHVELDVSDDIDEGHRDPEDLVDFSPPPHLKVPESRTFLTMVHTSRVQFCDVMYCSCDGSPDSYLQLMKAGLFPTTTKEPRTIFTFQVLDDFIRDDVECRTSSMNYYSKLQRNTSNAFPHLVPVGTLAIHDTTLIPFIGQILRATSSLQDVAVA